MLVNGTPVEPHDCGGRTVLVKREDLCAPSPGPAFSKVRGVYTHIKERSEPIIGVLDTYHSRAGWAVSWVCEQLEKACVDFYPEYKNDPELRITQVMAKKHKAALRPLPAGRSAILYHTAKRLLPDEGYMMPNALKLPESVLATSIEFGQTVFDNPQVKEVDVVVVSISSATIAAGVIQGLFHNQLRPLVILHMGYSRSEESVRRYVNRMSGIQYPEDLIMMVDEGYAYRDTAKCDPPEFPCDAYYDLKAWKWLNENMEAFAGANILFWNVG